jgi:hypothetical protein
MPRILGGFGIIPRLDETKEGEREGNHRAGGGLTNPREDAL